MDDRYVYQALGLKVSKARRKLGLTQKALSEKVGLSRASIANIEAGRQNVLVHQLYAFSEALELGDASALLPAPQEVVNDGFRIAFSGSTVSEKSQAQITDLLVKAGILRSSDKATP